MNIQELMAIIANKKYYENAEFFIKYNEKLGHNLLFSIIPSNPEHNDFLEANGLTDKNNWYAIDAYDPDAKTPANKIAVCKIVCDRITRKGKSIKYGEICLLSTSEDQPDVASVKICKKSFYQGKGISRELLNLAQVAMFKKEHIDTLIANITQCGCYGMAELFDIYTHLGFTPQTKLREPANKYINIPAIKVYEPCELKDIGFTAINIQTVCHNLG